MANKNSREAGLSIVSRSHSSEGVNKSSRAGSVSYQGTTSVVPLADEGQAGFKPLKVKETKDPQGLKARSFGSFGGTTEVMP